MDKFWKEFEDSQEDLKEWYKQESRKDCIFYFCIGLATGLALSAGFLIMATVLVY